MPSKSLKKPSGSTQSNLNPKPLSQVVPRNIKLTLEYDGTLFNGWQIQVNAKRTVQAEIQTACQKIFGHKITVIGSGRTDSGTHALGQVANFKTSSGMDPGEMLRALNGSLPDDISVSKVEEVARSFHAQYSAKSKIYRYTILNRPGRSAIQKKFCYHYPGRLNIALMKKDAKSLVGRHDFKSFQATPAKHDKEKSTVRTIKKLTLTRKGSYILIEVEADGFLHKMVRNIVGTLIEIGNGRFPKESMERILKAKNRLKAGPTAKARGLILLKVKY